MILSPGVSDKLRGRAPYAHDLTDGGTAIVGIVRSPHPHARVLSTDVSRALRVKGALAALTGADLPPDFLLDSDHPDEHVLVKDRARYVGDHVAALAAEDRDALREALPLVQVEYEPLPAALDAEAALAMGVAIHEAHPDNVALHHHAERGDFDAVAARVAHWAEGVFRIEPVQHAYMEPYAALATYEPGKVTVHAPVHAPSVIHDSYQPWAEGWEERLEFRTPAFGGSFGAKEAHPIHLLCAEFAHRLKRDVAIGLSRREDFLTARPRVDMTLRVRIGAAADGRLLAKEAEILANNGAYSMHGPTVTVAAAMRMDNLYGFEAIRNDARLVYTNTAPTECFRGFGDPEAAFAQEQLVDELAHRIGVSPFEIRRRNALVEGDRSVHGWQITSSGFADCLGSVESQMAAEPPIREPEPGGRFRTGLGIAGGMHVISNRARSSRDMARVRVRLAADGIMEILSGEVDVGGGTNRMLAGLVAGVAGADPARVRVVLGDSELCPYGLGSWASRTTFFAGNAALDAAHAFECALADLRSELGLGEGATLEEVARRAQQAGRLDALDVTGEYVSEGSEVPDESGYGHRSPAYTFAVHGCKVRVDTWTGRVEVLDYWAAHDSGTILDEVAAAGQVHGGVLQGLGHALSERVVRGRRGEMLNPGFLDYRIPTFLDAVPIHVAFTSTFDPGGPLGAKTVAEPPIIPVAACVANAVHDATGARVRIMPMEPETVFRALNRKQEE